MIFVAHLKYFLGTLVENYSLIPMMTKKTRPGEVRTRTTKKK